MGFSFTTETKSMLSAGTVRQMHAERSFPTPNDNPNPLLQVSCLYSFYVCPCIVVGEFSVLTSFFVLGLFGFEQPGPEGRGGGIRTVTVTSVARCQNICGIHARTSRVYS